MPSLDARIPIKRINNANLKEKYITRYALRENLSEPMIEVLQLQFYTGGEYLYHQGDQAEAFYLLLAGKLQVDYFQADGHQAVFSFVTPLSTLGDLELFEDWSVVKNVQALEDSLVLAAPAKIIRAYGYDDPRFLRFILHHVIKKIDFSSTLLAQVTLSLECRLARYLLYRLEKDGPLLRLEKREALAAMLGASIRHLNRTLKRFSALGTIEVHNKTLKIIDSQRLSAIAEERLKKGT